MADVSKIMLPNGSLYALKDESARSALADKAAASHTHTVSQISDFPSSLPANGGNADTVGNKSIDSILCVAGWYEGDLNDLKIQGSSIAVNCSNSPVPNGFGTVLCYAGGSGSFAQFFVADDGTTSTMFFRHFDGAKWLGWSEINTDVRSNASGIISDLSNNSSVAIPLSFTPAAVLFFNNYNHLVNSGFSLEIGTDQFIITPSSVSAMGTTTVRFFALRG